MAIGRIPEPGTGIPESIVDAKGDIVTATAADTPARLAVGTTEHRLVAASGEATGLKYVADTTNYAVAAKGDLLVGTAADTLAALTVGANGTTLVADSSTATGLKWATPAGGGKLLQLVTATGTSTNITSTSFTDVNLAATITPTSATSRVYVIISMGFYISRNQTNLQSDVRLLRGATDIWTTTSNAGISVALLNNPANMSGILPITYVDSPATTSATTYKVQAKVFSTLNGMSLDCNNYQTSVITLLEIGA
jgi:hypothetical protein